MIYEAEKFAYFILQNLDLFFFPPQWLHSEQNILT